VSERGLGNRREGGLGNRERYNRLARAYEALVRFASLGQFERFYRAVAAELAPHPGGRILDLGCGLGTLVPHLLPKVAPGGTVIGVDVSDALIARAHALAAHEHRQGVELVRADVRDFAPERPVDAVVFCLSLTTMPEPAACLERALSWLAPGGQLVVLDSFPDRARPLARWVIHAKAPFVGAEPSEGLLALLHERLDAPRVRQFHRGVYTLVSGRVP
jgi:demethylmenaquinone methyltransferase/2-methoxy-6-polyprenyl-1,4-benzoquinol methylase